MDRTVAARWLDAMPDAVVVVSTDGRIVHANARCETLLGWPPAELEGRTVDFLVPERGVDHAALRAGFLASPELRQMGAGSPLTARRRDGEEIAVDIGLSPIEVDGERYVVASIRDASPQRAHLEDLHLKSIALDEAASGIVITDLDGGILWVNRAAARMTGYARDELIGGTPRLLKSGAHDDAFYRELWRTIRAGRTWRGTIVNRRKDGTRYHEEQTIAPVRNAVGRVSYYIAIKQDVTDRIAAEAALRAANEALARQVREIEALQTLLREQAIRDPLTGLFNRRYLDETLAREVARAQRDRVPLTLAMIDLDHFKRVNDRFGHSAGDRLLASFGRVLHAQKRSGDFACRYGGEEFAVVLVGATLAGGLARAEGWRASYADLASQVHGEPGATTLSVGLAELDSEELVADLLARADAALYQAKAEGRDRVVAAPSGAG